MADDFGFDDDYEAELSGHEDNAADEQSEIPLDHSPLVPAFKAQLPQPAQPTPPAMAASSAEDEFGFSGDDADQLFADSSSDQTQQPARVSAIAPAASNRSPSARSQRSTAPAHEQAEYALDADDSAAQTLSPKHSSRVLAQPPAAASSPSHSTQRSSSHRTAVAEETVPAVRLTPKEGSQRSSRRAQPQSEADSARLSARNTEEDQQQLSSHRPPHQPSSRPSARLSERSPIADRASAGSVRSAHSAVALDAEQAEEAADAADTVDAPASDTDEYADELEPVSAAPAAEPAESSRAQLQQLEETPAAVDDEWPADDEAVQNEQETAPAAEEEPYGEEPAESLPAAAPEQSEEEPAEEKQLEAEDEYADNDHEQAEQEEAVAVEEEPYEDEPEPATPQPLAAAELPEERPAAEQHSSTDDEYADDEYAAEQSVVEEQPLLPAADELTLIPTQEQQEPNENEADYASEAAATDELPEDETATTLHPEDEHPTAAVPHIAPARKHAPKLSIHKPVAARVGPEVEEEEQPADSHYEVDEDVRQQRAAERRRSKAEAVGGRRQPKERQQEVEDEAHDEEYQDKQVEEEVHYRQAAKQRKSTSSLRQADVWDEDEPPAEQASQRSQRSKSAKKRVSIAPGVKSPSPAPPRMSIKRQPSALLPQLHRTPSHQSHHSHPQHHYTSASTDDADEPQQDDEDLNEYIHQLEDQNRLLQTRVRSLTKKQSVFAAQSSLLTSSNTLHTYSDRINELEHQLTAEQHERRTLALTIKRLEKDLMLADQQAGSLPQVLERMTAEVGREKERARRLRELSDDKEREVRRMVLQAVDMERRMRTMERMLSEHRAGMGQREGKADEARDREEEGRIEGEVQEYREQMRQLHGELTAQGAKREVLNSTSMGRQLLQTLDHTTNPRTRTTKQPALAPPPAPAVKRPAVPRQRRPLNPPAPTKPVKRYGALPKKPQPITVPAAHARSAKPAKVLSPTRGPNSRFPNVAAIRADLKRRKERVDTVQAVVSPKAKRLASVALPRPLQPAQLDRYPSHIPTLKSAVAVAAATAGVVGVDAKLIGNGPSQAAPALAAVMASIAKEEEEHRQMLQVRRESQLSAMTASGIGKGWKGEELKEQLVEVNEEEKTAVSSARNVTAIVSTPVKSAREEYGIDDEVADEAIAADDEYGDDFDG